MMKMINKRRVQRIKNLIYAFIILILFLPLILMSVLSFQMFGAIKDLNAKVDNLSKIAALQAPAQAPSESSAPDSGFVIEPDDQSSRPPGTANQETDGLEPEAGQDKSDGSESLAPNSENLAVFPNDGSSGADIQGEDEPLPADGGNELGGGAPLEEPESEYLAVAGGGSSGTAAEEELAANPQMGYGDDAPLSDHTANPSTGA